MSDQSPPPPPTVDADADAVLAELDALNSANVIDYAAYSRLHDMVGELGNALDAVTAERDALRDLAYCYLPERDGVGEDSDGEPVTWKKHAEDGWHAAGVELERGDQARAALREIAATRPNHFHEMHGETCSQCAPWHIASAALAGAPSGDTPQPAQGKPNVDSFPSPEGNASGLSQPAPSRDLAALAEKWEAEGQQHANRVGALMVDGDIPDEATVPVVLSVELARCARELRAALGDTPDPEPAETCPVCKKDLRGEHPACDAVMDAELADDSRWEPLEGEPTEEPDPAGSTQAHSADDPPPPHSSGEKTFITPCGRADEHQAHGAAGIRLCGGKLTWESGTWPPCGHGGVCMIRWQNGTFGGACVATPPHWVDLDAPAPAPATPEAPNG